MTTGRQTRALITDRIDRLIVDFVNGGDFPPELETGTARLYAGLWMAAEHEARRHRTAWQSARRRARALREQGGDDAA
jgi:hypothetical protein